jgi:hypothetical protein
MRGKNHPLFTCTNSVAFGQSANNTFHQRTIRGTSWSFRSGHANCCLPRWTTCTTITTWTTAHDRLSSLDLVLPLVYATVRVGQRSTLSPYAPSFVRIRTCCVVFLHRLDNASNQLVVCNLARGPSPVLFRWYWIQKPTMHYLTFTNSMLHTLPETGASLSPAVARLNSSIIIRPSTK